MAGVAGLLAMVWGVARYVEGRRFEARLHQARRLTRLGGCAEAGPLLARLAAERPARGEAALLLGDCEDAQGRPEAALAAWSRVPPGAPEAGAAAVRRGRRAIDLGRFTDAEEALAATIRRPGPRAAEARELLIRLFWREARFAEVAELIEAQWRDLLGTGRLSDEAALGLLRGHLSLDFETFPSDLIEADLRRAAALAPGDDRVRLALARWAGRGGRFDEARALLEGCARSRPDDPEVWLARLEVAQGSDRPDEARATLAQIPAGRLSGRQVASLRAWLAAARSDSATERAELERLVAIAPVDLAALERLAELLIRAGRRDEAARLRDRKAALGVARHRYLTIFKDDDLAARAIEMARIAGELGRRFEGWAFAIMAARRDPNDSALREAMIRVEPPAPAVSATGPSPTLADLLAADFGPVAERTQSATRPGPVVPRFEDDAAIAGLSFNFDGGATAARQLPEVMSGGIGLIDYDGDGRLDVYALQGGAFPPPPGRQPMGDRLFRNRGDGSFEDATATSGLAGFAGGYGHGIAVGDYDNDGFPDLFLTRWRAYALYRNRGDGTFEDATGRAGLAGDRDWPTSAAFADLDGDGDLDLYVCHYLEWDADHPRLCPDPAGKGNRSCDPRHFQATRDHAFRNDGGRFVEATIEGFEDRDGRGLGVLAADLDDDGRVDLFVANDGSANYLLRNRGGFRFEEVGLAAGVACNAAGSFQAGMGVAAGDLDGDGRLDLATANGHVNDDRPAFPLAMPAQLLLGEGGRLVDATRDAGPPWSVPRVGRGLAVGDLDNDGLVDLLIAAQDAPLAYFHNRSKPGRSATIRLEGTTSNRDGVGARVSVVAGGRRQVAPRIGGGSYLSASDPRLHFGLGEAERIEEIEVRWPSGRVDRHRHPTPRRGYLLREGAPAPSPLPGFDPPG